MKQTVIKAYDDVYWDAEKRRVEASNENVRLAFGDTEVELDLDDQHMDQLNEFLWPFLLAGTPSGTKRKRHNRPMTDEDKQGRIRARALHTFAKNRGLAGYPHVTRDGKKLIFSDELVKMYEESLGIKEEVTAG